MDISLKLSTLLWISIWISMYFYGYQWICVDVQAWTYYGFSIQGIGLGAPFTLGNILWETNHKKNKTKKDVPSLLLLYGTVIEDLLCSSFGKTSELNKRSR